MVTVELVFRIFIILFSLSLISYLIYYYWKNNKSKNRIKYYNKRHNYYSQINSNQNSESCLIDNSVYNYNYFYETRDNHKHVDDNELNTNNNSNNKIIYSNGHLDNLTMTNYESTNSSFSESSSSCGD